MSQASTSTELEDDPVGSGEWIVAQGECVSSIAAKAGHFWKKIWDLSENSELKSTRKDPNALLPNDRLTVPDIEPGEWSGAAEKRHRFRRKGVPSVLKLKIMQLGEPVADEAYTLTIDGEVFKGQTDGQGCLEQAISPEAQQGKLLIPREQGDLCYNLDLGTLDPVDTTTGIKARLKNLGFDAGPINMEHTDEFASALGAFQEHYELEKTGVPDQATIDKLEELTQ